MTRLYGTLARVPWFLYLLHNPRTFVRSNEFPGGRTKSPLSGGVWPKEPRHSSHRELKRLRPFLLRLPAPLWCCPIPWGSSSCKWNWLRGDGPTPLYAPPWELGDWQAQEWGAHLHLADQPQGQQAPESRAPVDLRSLRTSPPSWSQSWFRIKMPSRGWSNLLLLSYERQFHSSIQRERNCSWWVASPLGLGWFY